MSPTSVHVVVVEYLKAHCNIKLEYFKSNPFPINMIQKQIFNTKQLPCSMKFAIMILNYNVWPLKKPNNNLNIAWMEKKKQQEKTTRPIGHNAHLSHFDHAVLQNNFKILTLFHPMTNFDLISGPKPNPIELWFNWTWINTTWDTLDASINMGLLSCKTFFLKRFHPPYICTI